MKISNLGDLGAVWRQHRETRRLVQQATEKWAQAQADLHAGRMAHTTHLHAGAPPAPHGLFARSVGPVLPLRDPGRADIALPRPPPHPRQRELDEQAALAESLSDEVNLESLLLTDDGLSFRRPGIGPSRWCEPNRLATPRPRPEIGPTVPRVFAKVVRSVAYAMLDVHLPPRRPRRARAERPSRPSCRPRRGTRPASP